MPDASNHRRIAAPDSWSGDHSRLEVMREACQNSRMAIVAWPTGRAYGSCLPIIRASQPGHGYPGHCLVRVNSLWRHDGPSIRVRDAPEHR